jgi:hypothetical protein
LIKKDYSAKNAIKNLYLRKYQIDKQNSFKVPRLKIDIEAYLHLLLDAVENAFEEGNVIKYSGHELKWPSRTDKEDVDDNI